MPQYLSQLSKSDLEKKIVLLRLDLNLPIADGKVLDDSRLLESLKTIKFLRENRAKIIIISHLGRPKGINLEFSMSKILPNLLQYLPDIVFKSDSIFELTKSDFTAPITILENIRFYDEELKNNLSFSKKLANLADIYINDAFSASHREHSSVVGVAKILPNFYGLNFEHELKVLDSVISGNEKPKVAIIGGKKVSTKFAALKSLSQKMDTLIIGGAMANTFAAAAGYDMKASYIESSMLDEVRDFLQEYHHADIYIPEDFVVTKSMESDDTISQLTSEVEFRKESNVRALEDGDIALDLGSKSVKRIKEIVSDAKFLLWNGPLGYYEDQRFRVATERVADHIAKQTEAKMLISISAGGDILAALKMLDLADKFSYTSTSGGAFLDYIANNGKLPGYFNYT